MPQHLVLVKHALPTLDAGRPACEWSLSSAGQRQCKGLAGRLRSFAPLRLVTSPEAKAVGTAELVAAALGVQPVVMVDGLREIDRPVMPVMPRSELEFLIKPIFAEPHRPVLGVESGVDACSRFSAAISSQVAQSRRRNLIAITHGTVISLFVGAHNAIDAFDVWRQLKCASLVVLEVPTYRLVDIVHAAGSGG